MTLKLGWIADDFTGGTDLANNLVRAGMRTVQVIGVPDAASPAPDADAVVVALKSRTAPVAEAVAQSVVAARWLRAPRRRGRSGLWVQSKLTHAPYEHAQHGSTGKVGCRFGMWQRLHGRFIGGGR